MFNIVFNTTAPTLVLGGIVAGVLLLLYGVRLVSDALQQTTTGRLQQSLTNISQHPPAAFGIGIVITALMQSSSAVASLLVELVSSNLLPLSVAMVMVLGANVGSTLVVQLLALHVTDHALDLVEVGAVVAFFTHRTPFRRLGQALFAFGLIALGLATIDKASLPLAESPITKSVLQAIDNAPLLLVLIGSLLAVLFNSSVATIGLVLTLTANGALPVPSALALMLGANVGTTFLPLFSSLNGGMVAGRRLAVFHSGTKILVALCLLPMLGLLVPLLQTFIPGPGTQVALAHLGFNLLLAVLFTPFSGPLAVLMKRLWPVKSPTASAPVLDPRALKSPALAQGLATREMLRMADIVTHMLEISIRAFGEQPDVIHTRIEAMEDQLDELNAAIKGYLTQIDEEKLSSEQVRREISMLTVVGDLEAIGDVITNRFMRLAYRRLRAKVEFSEEGWKDLVLYHQQIEKALQQVLAALATQNPRLATEFLARQEQLKWIKQELHRSHIRRLRTGNPDTMTSSSIHLDLLDAMSTVLAHTSNMAHALTETS